MRLRFLLAIILIPFFLHAQFPFRRLGYAPFLYSFNPNKLAHALTDGLPNDSMKVRSIYLWTTHHIRYDTRAFADGRGSFTSPRSILFFRRAVCFGYSILFDSLCKIAGINAQVVPGYVREPWYEARDTLYLDTHAWNVVQVDGEWKIIDVTWASGVIKMKKQRFAKMLDKYFDVPYRQKLKFKRKLNDDYYFSDPEKIILTHLPSAPAWQLLTCTVPIDSFQWSPQAVQHYLDDPVNCKNGFDSIPSIVNEPERRQMIAEGKQALRYNKNNHQDLALGYYENGMLIYFDAEDTLRSVVERIGLYDSVMVQMDSAAMAFTAAANDCKNEGNYFLRRNKRMKKQLYSENKPLIKKQGIEATDLRRQKSVARKTILHLEAQNRKLVRASKKIKRDRIEIVRPGQPIKNEEAYRANLEEAIHTNEDDINAYEDSISFVTYNLHADEPVIYMKNLDLKKGLLSKELLAEKYTLFYREAYNLNSFDTLLINQKKIIFKCEHQRDSLNQYMRPAGNWIVDSSAALYFYYVKQMDVLMKENMKYCKQLGKLNKSGFKEKQFYKETRKNYVRWNDSLIVQNNYRIHAYKSYNEALSAAAKNYIDSRNNLNLEIRVENARFDGENSFYKNYYFGHQSQMKHDAINCKNTKKNAMIRKRFVISQEQKRLAKIARLAKKKKVVSGQ